MLSSTKTADEKLHGTDENDVGGTLLVKWNTKKGGGGGAGGGGEMGGWVRC